MELHLLKQADQILTKCGARPVIREGSVVTLTKSFIMPMVLDVGQTTIQFTKEITGETTWTLRAISSSAGSNTIQNVRVQIQFPNGRFLFGGLNGQDIGQFAWIGSWTYAVDPELDFEPGGKIQVTLSAVTPVATPTPINLLFEGCYKYFLRGGSGGPPDMVSNTPRYQSTVNQNILAPCYTAGYGPGLPDDELFTYTQQPKTPITFVVGTAPSAATVLIPIDPGIDFYCRRLLFDVGFTGAATGVILARVRTGDGYALTDDYIDIARYLNGAQWAHDWHVRGGDAVFIDLQLVDATSAEDTITFQAFLEGVKRRLV